MGEGAGHKSSKQKFLDMYKISGKPRRKLKHIHRNLKYLDSIGKLSEADRVRMNEMEKELTLKTSR